ncbi:hypothetical protein ACFWBH_34610 [Streptomyces sp. NPDC059999]|uniref:hypothetical protein n=1 Tax=Streptomyces sp. NPDC059999 TaxID=3347030 RepID=UPI00369A9F6C
MPTSTSITAVTVACLLGFTLAACGPTGPDTSTGARASAAPPSAPVSPDVPASTLLARGYETTQRAHPKKVRSETVVDGVKVVTSQVFDTDTDSSGEVVYAGIGRSEIFVTIEHVYTRSDEGFIRHGLKDSPRRVSDAAVARFAGRWVKRSRSSAATADIVALRELASPFTEFLEDRKDQPTARFVRRDVLDGTPVDVVTSRDAEGHTATSYIAAEGRPYLLKRTETGAEPTEYSYGDFLEPNPVTPPADAEVVTAS